MRKDYSANGIKRRKEMYKRNKMRKNRTAEGDTWEETGKGRRKEGKYEKGYSFKS
jgi:hypothetical protein